MILANDPTAPDQPLTIVAARDWLAMTARLTRWNLFQMWRRPLTKVLLGVVVGLYLLTVLGLALFLAATESQTGGLGVVGELLRANVTFPLSVTYAAGYITLMGVVAACIVAGSVVGGEYGYSTQRLALSRGVGRGQALAAQAAAQAALALVVAGGMMLLGILVGLTLGPALGGSPSGFSLGGLGQLLGYWGALSLRLFAYSLIALFLATLGRSTAAGVGGALGFIVAEPIFISIMTLIIGAQRLSTIIGMGGTPIVQLNALGQTLTVIINGLLQPNANALAQAAQQGPLPLSPPVDPGQLQNALLPPPGTLQALVVLLVWVVALIGASYWLVRTRDVTD